MEESDFNLNQEKKKSNPRIRNPKEKEHQVYTYLREQNRVVSFHEMFKDLKMSDGALQATIKRCLKPNTTFRIYESSKISEKTSRKIRVFAYNPDILSSPVLNIEDLYKLASKIHSGEIIKSGKEYVLPLGLDENTTNLLVEITKISNNINSIGELRPGSLSKQYNVCGKQSCKCKDPKNPQKHGPYYQISYSRKGKSSSAFVKPEFLTEARTQLSNYKKLMELITTWVDLGLEHSKIKMKLLKEEKKILNDATKK